jgi:hypothetical protein
VTLRALAGLTVFNVFLLGVGIAVLSAVGGWRTGSDLVRSSGLAYLVGVALLGVTLSIELTLGVPFSLATIVLTGAAICAVAIALRRPGSIPRRSSGPCMARASWQRSSG